MNPYSAIFQIPFTLASTASARSNAEVIQGAIAAAIEELEYVVDRLVELTVDDAEHEIGSLQGRVQVALDTLQRLVDAQQVES